MRKKALITGIYGQDGSYLAELLFSKDYEVYGIIRTKLSDNSLEIKNYLKKRGIKLVEIVADLTNYNELKISILKINPDEIYHLAATHQSSQDGNPEHFSYNKNICATSNILAICYESLKTVKILLAGSCLMFDNSETQEQNEKTLFASNGLYGLGKIAENQLAKYYCNKGLFVCDAILYNHESSRRSDKFVTKKIVKNMVALKQGKIKQFSLGNLNVRKDWGYAKDYALAMWLMTQTKIPEDYILATNRLHSISEFIEICAEKLAIKEWEKFIEIDNNIITRKIKTTLLGDYTKARENLGWNHSFNLEGLIELMIKNEINNELL